MNNQLIIESLPFGVIHFNLEGLIIDANKKVEQILRVDIEQITGKIWNELPFKFINKEGVELTINKHPILQTLLKGENIVDQVVGVVHLLSRDIIWIKTSIIFDPINQANNLEQRQLVMYLTDVTDLVNINITTQDIIEKINLGAWEWDMKTDGAIYCDKWAQMLGYTLDELKPINIDVWRRMVHPDDLKVYENHLQEHIYGNSPHCSLIVRMQHKDGHWEWIRDIGKVTQWSENGEPLYMAGIHQNISDYKNNEHHLSLKIEYGKILKDISTQFINTADIDDTIIESFAKLASIASASRVYLFRINADGNTISNTHEWCREGVKPQKDDLQDLPIDDFLWSFEKLSNGEIINISDISKIPLEGKSEKEFIEYQGIKSLLIFPINIKHSLAGFIGLDNVAVSESWSGEDVDLLSTTASIFSYALEKQLAKEELTRNYLNLRAYFDLNSDFIMILNEHGEIIEVNKQVTKRLGYTNEEIIGKHVLMMHPIEFQEKATQIVLDMMEDTIATCPLPILTKSGEQILVETSVTKGLWDGENALFAMSKDISEKVFSEQKFEKIFQNIPIIATLTDISTNQYIEVNRVFHEKLGFTTDEAIGSNAIDLLGLNPDICKQVSLDLSGDGFIRNFETIIYHKDGTPIHVHLSAASIYLLDRKYGLTLATDITESKKTQQQLIDAKVRAEESDRLKSAFLATMNHELRTPLNHIIGFSDMLPDMTDDESIKEFSKIIHKSGLNLLNIIEDVFDLALMEQSDIRLRNDEVYIRDIYIELKKHLQQVLSVSDKGKNINLSFKINSGVVSKRIITDKSKVLQVMSNLINNAVKFTHEGEIALEFYVESDNMLSIIIKDTGVGIPKDKQGIIFEFFRQVDDSHTRIFEGIGIGLAISQKIATAMGGKISVKSDCDEGSEFKFSFPIELHDDQFFDTTQGASSSISLNLSGKTILVVEDDVVGMEMIVNILSTTQCKIIKAVNGYEAVKVVVGDPTIDLVLMDLKMPVMDGFEATKFIRQELPNLPIVALTAYSMRKDRDKAMGVGCNDIVTKPVNRVILLKKIEGILLN